MVYLFIFFIELFSLFFCSQALIKSISYIAYRISHSQTVTIHLLAGLFLPGTIIHELAHALVAGALLVPVGKIEFLPEIQGDRVKLGSAQIAHSDPFRRALIGFAPVIVGTLLLLGSLFYFVSMFSKGTLPFWSIFVLLYIIFEITNTMFSSRKDLEGSLEVIVIVAGIFIALYFLGIRQPFTWFASLFQGEFLEFVKKVVLFMLIPIVIDILIYALFKIFLERRSLFSRY